MIMLVLPTSAEHTSSNNLYKCAPENKVIWRSLTRFTDIELGAIIGAQLVGKLEGSSDAYRKADISRANCTGHLMC